MKEHLLIISTALFLFSCNNTQPVENKTQNVSSDSSNIVFASDFTVPFSGFWISENYYNVLKNTRSARIAQEKTYESFIVITSKSTQATSIIYNVHDGGAKMIVRKKGNNYEFWSDTENKKYYDIHVISENKLKIGDISFIKLSDYTEWSDEGIQELIGEIVFKGTYADSSNIVTFGENGKLTGLDEFSYYTPLIDYYDTAMDIDQILLGKEDVYYKPFGYKLKVDTLLLYDLECAGNMDEIGHCDSTTFGALQYKLLKQ